MTLDGTYTPQRVQRKTIRRNKFEIWAELLEACARTSRTQSWLLRKVGLKTSAIKEALDFLKTAGLLSQQNVKNNQQQFITTKKGEDALTQYYQLITKYFGKE